MESKGADGMSLDIQFINSSDISHYRGVRFLFVGAQLFIAYALSKNFTTLDQSKEIIG